MHKLYLHTYICIRWSFRSRFLFHPTRHSLRHMIWVTTNSLILLFYVCGMYKSNSNFGAGCRKWADWAYLRFGFVHYTDIIEQNKSVYHNQDISTHIWWLGIWKLIFKTSSNTYEVWGEKLSRGHIILSRSFWITQVCDEK